MLEKLLSLKNQYEGCVGNQRSQAAALDDLKDTLLGAFPDLYRAFVETIEENRLLRGMAANSLVAPAPNAAPLIFTGYLAQSESEGFDSLHDYAASQQLVVGDEFTITETYMRDVHYAIRNGPTQQDPLARFNFDACAPCENADPAAEQQNTST
ncbi:hypothetical protein [Burkholderia sp. Ac-20365]|uniref:hypothetical protein n=1 Tax=Burkholderia sp. Ac-20365 TaxID=2703897 RepID=UPI00197B81AA|nr:hypothetical protein [Burkholderia sp. Ac-20365]MBN3760933.1 hypothetical protein [Burkholderia sp. Ac-20365]